MIGIVGTYASPYAPGCGLCAAASRLRRDQRQEGCLGPRARRHGRDHPGHGPIGGRARWEIRLNSAVRELIVERGRAVGARTHSGDAIRARVVVSNLNPKLLYQQLLDPALLPADFRQRIDRWRCGSGTFRMNVALSGLPGFSCPPGKPLADHHTAGMIIAPTLSYMEQAYFDARSGGWSRKPIVEVVIPSTLDDSLAPPGQHVASLFCQHVAREFSNGESWDSHRDKVADLMIETVNQYAPNFKAAVLGRQMKTEFGS